MFSSIDHEFYLQQTFSYHKFLADETAKSKNEVTCNIYFVYLSIFGFIKV